MTIPSWLSSHYDLSCRVLLCILATCSLSLLLLLGPYCFCPFSMPIVTWNVSLVSLIFWEIPSLSHSVVFLLFFALFIEKGLQSLLFSGNLHSVGYIFPFLPCLSLLTFPQLFVKPSQTTTLPSGISFSWGWFWSLSPIQHYEPPSIVLQTLPTRSNPLNLFVTSPV